LAGFLGLSCISSSTIGGDLLAFKLTPANTDDRTPVPEMTRGLWESCFGDKGYISQPLFELLFKTKPATHYKIKKNMKNKLMPMADKILLAKTRTDRNRE